MPGKQFIRLAVLVAFVMPNFITVIAWILLAGPNAGLINVFLRDFFGVARGWSVFSQGGLILVLTFSFYPLVFFATTAALDNMDPSYEEAAQMSGASSWRGSLGISLPLVLPAIVSSSVFVFLEAMGAFGAPAAIGNAAYFHTLTTKIYELFSYPPRFELAAAAATPIIIFTVLGLMLQRYATGRRRYTVISAKPKAARAVEIGAARWLLFVFSMLVIFASVALPLLVLIRTSLVQRWGRPMTWDNLTLRNYAAMLRSGDNLARRRVQQPGHLGRNREHLRRAGAVHCLAGGANGLARPGASHLPQHGDIRLSRHRARGRLRARLSRSPAGALRHYLAVLRGLHRAPFSFRVPVRAQRCQTIVERTGGGGPDVRRFLDPHA